MPYIREVRRVDLAAQPLISAGQHCMSPGELNWMLTNVALSYLYRNGPDPDYARMSEAMGAFTCAAQEFYRRVMAPYEDEKKEENGDVY